METPILQRMTGGAAARPFKTHHNALDRHLYLRIATELYLKRAIVGGFEDVYELGKFFRNEGMSPQHNPEFTMLEWFVSGVDYHGVMDVAEGIVADVAERVLGTTKVERDGETIDLAPPWPRLRLQDRCSRRPGSTSPRRAATSWPRSPATTPSPTTTGPALVDTLQGKLVEPKLIQPTFIDRPAAGDLAAGQAGRPSTRSCWRRPSTGSSPGWRSPAAAPTSTTRSNSAATSSNSANGRSRGRRRRRTSTTRSSCGRSNTGC